MIRFFYELFAIFYFVILLLFFYYYFIILLLLFYYYFDNNKIEILKALRRKYNQTSYSIKKTRQYDSR